MCSMMTQNNTNLKDILNKIPANTIVTAKKLKENGVSYSLMRAYENSGWLTRHSAGAYTRLAEIADILGALYAIQKDCRLSVHIGADTALKMVYGKIHFLKPTKEICLFAFSGTKLPSWFKIAYNGQYSLHLTNFLPNKLGLIPYKNNNYEIDVPNIERSLLELLYLVPKVITAQEAYSITETIQSLRTGVLQQLLEQCSSIKVKRLLLCFAEQSGQQWIKAIDLKKIDFGKGIREIEKGGILYKKYGLVLPRLG